MAKAQKEPTVRAMGDRVIVQPDKKDEKSKGGIVLPADMVKNHAYEWGTVYALSHSPIDVDKWGELAVGDRVLYPAYTVTNITQDKDAPLYSIPLGELTAIEKK